MDLTNQKYRLSEVGIIPVEWEVMHLGDIANVIGGGTPSTFNDDYWNGDINWFTPTEIGLKKYSYESIRKITKKGLENSPARILPIGTILLTSRAGIGDVSILMNEACTNQGFQSLVAKGEINNEFLYYVVTTLKKVLLQNASGSTFLEISPKKVKSIQLALPPTLKEQTAITAALSDIDTLIENLAKLIAKNRNIKQGVMQEFLTGRKRLDGFNEKWQKKRLGEIISLQGGYAFKSEQFQDKGISIIRISNINNNTVDLSEVVYYPEFNIPNEFIIKKGDVLIAMSGATTGKIGIYKFPFYSYQNQRVGKFVLNNAKTTDLNYISHLVSSDRFKSSLQKEIAQGAQPNISGKQIESIVLDIPTDIKEQSAIADILSSIESEIEALDQKLHKYEKLKQGMMQVLLTGKIRLV